MTIRICVFALSAMLLLSCSGRERLGAPPPGLHKRLAAAITYFLDRGASDELELGAREAFQLWSDATNFKFSYGGKAAVKVARDGRNEVVLAKKWPEELPIGDAAWCQVYLDSAGGIVEADILLNAQAFSFTTSRDGKAGSLYIEEVLAREIGRSLGLGIGREGDDRYRRAQVGDSFRPDIAPDEMAAYLSLYTASQE